MVIIQLNNQNFKEEVLKSDTPVLVDFHADWCGPCKMLGVVVEEISSDYDGKVKFCKLNIDEASELAAQYGVMSIPTIIIFKDGKVVSQNTGAVPKEKLKEMLDAL